MGKKLYVGGLPYQTTKEELEELFSSAGKVESVDIIMDRATGQSKGFGFVEMSTDEEAQKAISEHNNTKIGDRSIIVNEARPREDKPSNDFGGGQRNRY